MPPSPCSPSLRAGIDDFDNVSVQDVAAALPVIKALGVPLLVHAELVDEDVPSGVSKPGAERAMWLVTAAMASVPVGDVSCIS